MYYRATVIIENKTDVDEDALYEDLYGKIVGKGKIVEIEGVEVADDFDDSELSGISDMGDED